MTIKEAILTLNANVIIACERAGFDSATVKMAGDALNVIENALQEQVPVKPILKREGWNKYHNYYVCPVCDQELVYEQNYCSECGREVEWDA